MLLGYLPPVKDRQPSGLQKKREEYEELRRRHYLPVEAEAPSIDVDAAGILRQIRLDIPRTSPGLPIFSHPRIQQLLERILFIWSVRHPASGYVQGINDLATPFVVVLLASELDCLPEEINVDAASDDAFEAVEAGAYWCLTKFLSDIQDHYTNGQPGIQQMVAKLREIVHRIDQKLYDHLEEQGLDFLQLSFRWMNCLLLREFPFPCVIRLWDTYISEPLEGFSSFHVYVCTLVEFFLDHWLMPSFLLQPQKMVDWLEHISPSILAPKFQGLCCVSHLLVSAAETDGLSAADVVHAETANWKMA